MEAIEIKMGKLPPSWDGNGRMVKSITFCVTEDCNLACKYCYMTGKNSKRKMNFDIARKAVDYILTDKESWDIDGAVVWDFIGGEPFLEIELIDQISDYIKQQMLLLDHPWFGTYKFSFSSNGILYNHPKVQDYIIKNRNHISIGLSVDGNKIKHDLQRVYPDGSGSFDDVMRNVPLWMKQFGDVHTKATFSHDDLPYLKDSIISLWNIGIKTVAANVVFEDVWQEGDDVILEDQLRELGDYIIENKLWEEHSVRFLDPNIGFPIDEEDRKKNFCGAGKMLAVDVEGKFYPCIRFLDFTLNKEKELCMGDVENGINRDKIRPFYGLYLDNQSTQECKDCEVATGCAWCTGFNYDCFGTVYKRATYICKMHKATVRANEYFWNRYSEVTGLKSPRDDARDARLISRKLKFMQFLTADNVTPHCHYRSNNGSEKIMSPEIVESGLAFAKKNGYMPVFIGAQAQVPEINLKDSIFIVDAREKESFGQEIRVFDNNADCESFRGSNCTLLINKENTTKIHEFVSKLITRLSGIDKRVNIVLENIEVWQDCDIENYKVQLERLSNLVVEQQQKRDRVEINVLTDRLSLKSFMDCDAGSNIITLAPNGKLYLCPAFYFENPEDSVGDLEIGVNIKNKHLLDLENAPICMECDSYHCMRCKFMNKSLTGEINTPSKIQCIVSHIERNATRELQKKLIKLELLPAEELVNEIDYLDPLEKLIRKEKRGIYVD